MQWQGRRSKVLSVQHFTMNQVSSTKKPNHTLQCIWACLSPLSRINHRCIKAFIKKLSNQPYQRKSLFLIQWSIPVWDRSLCGTFFEPVTLSSPAEFTEVPLCTWANVSVRLVSDAYQTYNKNITVTGRPEYSRRYLWWIESSRGLELWVGLL